jgi:hypothetical protein
MSGVEPRERSTFAPANQLEAMMASYLPRLGLTGMGGIGQMTPAQVGSWRKARGAASGVVKRKRSKKKAAAAGGGKRKRKRKSSGSAGKLKKGSAAAKAYMAKIRKMRK